MICVPLDFAMIKVTFHKISVAYYYYCEAFVTKTVLF